MIINTLDLVRFDPVRNCFVLKGTPMHKWPDGTPKSMHNSFNWRENALGILSMKPANIPARSKDMHSNGSIYSYGKAVKASTAPKTITKHGKGKMFTINKEIP